MAVGAMEGLANSTCHRQAGNGDRLAQEKLPTVLALEGSKRQSRPTSRDEGGPASDSQNEPREPHMGRVANSRPASAAGARRPRAEADPYTEPLADPRVAGR